MSDKEKILQIVWEWICAVNDGAGFDAGDLGWSLEQAGFGPPDDE